MKILQQEQIDAKQFSFSSQFTFSCQGLTIDGKTQQVSRDNEPITLTKTEYQLLLFLAVHADRVLSREELFDAVWGSNSEDTIKVVANTISNLRKKIGNPKDETNYIRTVQGGYVFGKEFN